MFKKVIRHAQQQKNNREQGQGLVEYALILVMVAVVVLIVLSILGPTIGNIFSTVIDGLSGNGVALGGNNPPQNVSRPCQIYTIEGYDAWETHGEPFPGTYSAPWTSISMDQPTNPGHPSCSVYGAWLP